MRPRRKWRRRLAWLCGGFAASLVMLWGAMMVLMTIWVAKPPEIKEPETVIRQVAAPRGDRVYLGRNWFERRDGIPVLYLTGTPFEMGHANGVLTRTSIYRQEETVVALLRHVAPYPGAQFLLKFLVTYKNRHMIDHVTPAMQEEMLGISRGCPDSHPELGPYFNRILNYHGAQDISYMLMNSPLIRRGCTSFGAWGPLTSGGHLITGRNFDWEADPVFDEDRIVILCEPKEGIPFISLAWSGMAGCVSGLNRAGLSVTLNGAPSELPAHVSTPTCLVAREILQFAHNIEEAAAIIRKRQVFVSTLFLVGSRQDGKFVVIEKTPDSAALLEPASGENVLVSANHYLTSELRDHPLNAEFMRGDTSVARSERMTELVCKPAQPLDAAACVAVLRDRRLPGGQFPGNGHRGALNPLIATHATVMDLTRGLFWAATRPHQLGRFVAFDVQDPERLLPDEAVAEDPMLSSGEYRRYLAAKAKLGEGWQALKRKDWNAAVDCARQAETNNPGFYQNAWLLAEGLLRQGKGRDAALASRQALEGKPAMAGERRRIEQLELEAQGRP